MVPTIPIEKFGQDHWSTFAYVETRAVDDGGKLNPRKMRGDGFKYPTRLKNEENPPEGHNDWDCLFDLESAGLLVSGGSIYPMVHLTPLGWKVASQLRQWKAAGNNFATFVPDL